ncbi:hypothetical protein [Pseudalkalibacillus decolorationis]|uniref:hypothetical protein n=1 Tax=Pseudalkalibacillus decolorationis TaxID=163879 RepID=UPI0021498741|nr:hypothetical protein [Pseudalkalibacillus decolorationis]
MSNIRLFAGEKLLVILSMIGFAFAAGISFYIAIYGSIIPPEGNLERAFSFNAALALFTLTIAAILPLANISPRKRSTLRWVIITTTLYAYAVETIQHFRGINPRFSRAGSVGDSIIGALFGLDSLLIIIVTVLIAIPFFRKAQTNDHPLLILGIRYGFISTMIAFGGGLWMIALQSRYIGEYGNLIVLHGIGFHALQALPILGLLLELANIEQKKARLLGHTGCLAWTFSLLLIGIQTGLGRSVFELTLLPIFSGVMLLVWMVTVVIVTSDLIRTVDVSDNQDHSPI